MNEISGTLLQPQIESWHADRQGRKRFWTNCQKTAVCPPGYWQIASRNCLLGLYGESQVECSPPNPDLCPDTRDPTGRSNGNPRQREPVGKLSGSPLRVEFVSEHPENSQYTRGEPVKCIYEAGAVQTLEDINTWIRNFGRDDTLKQKILPRFCSQKRSGADCAENTCKLKANQQGCVPTCTVFNAVGGEGEICREWKNEMRTKDPSLHDTTLENACKTHKTDDCDCILRGSDPLYQQLKQGKPYEDRCWWTPCANPSSFLVKTNDQGGACPSTICQQIINAAGLNDTSISLNNQWKLNCALPSAPATNPATNPDTSSTGSTSTPPPLVDETNDSDNENNTPPPSKTDWKKYVPYAVGGTIGLLAVSLLIVLLIRRARR